MEHLAKHECEGTGMFISIYADDDGDWILETDDDRTGIKFCPFCGLHLPPVTDELIQARKAELEEIERNRPPRKHTPLSEMDAMLKDLYAKPIVDYLNSEGPKSNFLRMKGD